MNEDEQEPQNAKNNSRPDNEKSARKPWITPTFTLVGDLKDAQNSRGTPTDFILKGAHNPPGQGS